MLLLFQRLEWQVPPPDDEVHCVFIEVCCSVVCYSVAMLLFQRLEWQVPPPDDEAAPTPAECAPHERPEASRVHPGEPAHAAAHPRRHLLPGSRGVSCLPSITFFLGAAV